jgi:hypothetical protein
VIPFRIKSTSPTHKKRTGLFHASSINDLCGLAALVAEASKALQERGITAEVIVDDQATADLVKAEGERLAGRQGGGQ